MGCVRESGAPDCVLAQQKRLTRRFMNSKVASQQHKNSRKR